MTVSRSLLMRPRWQTFKKKLIYPSCQGYISFLSISCAAACWGDICFHISFLYFGDLGLIMGQINDPIAKCLFLADVGINKKDNPIRIINGFENIVRLAQDIFQ